MQGGETLRKCQHRLTFAFETVRFYFIFFYNVHK